MPSKEPQKNDKSMCCENNNKKKEKEWIEEEKEEEKKCNKPQMSGKMPQIVSKRARERKQ